VPLTAATPSALSVGHDGGVADASLISIASDVSAGRRRAAEVVDEALAAIVERDGPLHAFVAVDADRARVDAAGLDARIAAGEDVGPLAGVPLAVKDTEDTIGYRTTYGSRLWADAPLATADSILVARLKAAGCIVVGKTNTPELAAKGVCDNLLFGITRNPLNTDRTPGGSSGGSAAAVAAGIVPLGTASDGGGSIRIPAAACGLPGFKPSLGRVPDGGPNPVDWPAVTTRGVLTRTVDELLRVLDVIVGPHPTDLRSLPAPSTPWTQAVAQQPMPKRIAWSPTLGYADVDPRLVHECGMAAEGLAAQGIEIVEVDSVFEIDPVFTWLTLVASYQKRTVGDRDRSLMDPVVASYLAIADGFTAQQIIEAEDECHRLNVRLAALFAEVDLLLTPTLSADPVVVGTDGDDTNFVKSTYPFNLTRSPAGTMPVGTSAAGLPVGLQIVGPQHGDVAVLHLMRFLETASE
jgi:aspartyl-tRNA(Asn)/glutamyl-tRNA(Gln) amidotransferase subunit A